MAKLLIVDDEEKIREVVREYAEFDGYEVTEAADGREAVALCRINDFDIIIMDIMMPKLDGFSACKEIRKEKNTPVIMMSARSEEYDKLFGFELGIDDYVTKPFSIMELISRIKAVLRRSEKQEQDVLSAGGIVLDRKRHTVSAGGRDIVLTYKEFELLSLLMQNRNIVLERDRLLNEIWGYDFDGETRTIDVHIRTLRSKLGDAGAYIKTVRGIGYKLEDKQS